MKNIIVSEINLKSDKSIKLGKDSYETSILRTNIINF